MEPKTRIRRALQILRSLSKCDVGYRDLSCGGTGIASARFRAYPRTRARSSRSGSTGGNSRSFPGFSKEP